MSVMKTVPYLLHGFFDDWLVRQRNASHNTVLAYRDTWRLFLRFVAARRQRDVAKLGLPDLTAAEVLAFLEHLEQVRHDCIATRNCRLAALRSFFLFVANCEPAAAAQCADVLRIPSKRHPRRSLCYLEPDEVSAILAQPDRTTLRGQRDHALLALLYNSGARIQEVLDLRPKDVRLEPPAQVQVVGKGRKERICPIWAETAVLLAALLRRQPRVPEERIFVNRYGRPLTASGVRFRLRQYVASAGARAPRLKDKRVSPHTFRHTAAVHLVAAGVDITVIRSWLGHVDLDTTYLYAQANLETKRKALEQADPAARPGKPPRWKRDAELLAWLDAL